MHALTKDHVKARKKVAFSKSRAEDSGDTKPHTCEE